MKPKIFVTRKLRDEVVSKLRDQCEVFMWEEEDIPVPREVLLKEIEDVDGLYCLLTETIDKELLNKGKNLKVVSNMAVGFNNIDVNYATELGVAVTNTPGVLTETTADFTFSLLMTTARRIVEAEAFLKEGTWRTWSPMLLTGQDIYGSTLGIIGLGRIGEALARRAVGFNMKVIYANPKRRSDLDEELGLEHVELEILLKSADFVSLLTPYTPETENLISYDEINLMKENAILINTSRGGIVNEEALFDALKQKKIWGAGLDVFQQEPVSLDHPLLSLPNVVATPHIASASINTRLKMAHLAAENLIEVLNNNNPKHLVNPEYTNNR
ncbi:2-hydroxyacid dehydrogenase [Evansella cellulosilytica]|uniref:Glyoxylate reductase n=1 Tax=Evansella cellulosilytica (strain ATCC 21833 / DSM 2522 / FERM P-1141 / JCM 9156 / N-4) TaxID=649639 RepID=E6TTH8_EVAC2|nr:D-glycerate dehydrogenase [Evansella cellulosilytica]ADU29614.1 Glyoxylate reductase [Evansella cellulosilytica DSM 2522]